MKEGSAAPEKAHRATRSYEQLAREILEEAAEIDAAEDERYGDGAVMSFPPEP